MSISVALDELRAAIDETDRAPYLVTVSDDGRPHTVAVPVSWVGDELSVTIGTTTLANARLRPLVCLLWAPAERGGYSLIVDAEVTATADGTPTAEGPARDHRLFLRPTRATRHRPAPGSDAAYDPDCVRIPLQ